MWPTRLTLYITIPVKANVFDLRVEALTLSSAEAPQDEASGESGVYPHKETENQPISSSL
jgi:hypothetical protein